MGQTLYPTIRPLLSLEQFFLHSSGKPDLCYNIYPYPEKIDQYEFHCSIRSRPDVWNVYVSITQLDEEPALEASDLINDSNIEWPNSDHTLIVTSADEATIRSWFPDGVQPDTIDISDWSGSEWAVPPFIPSGFHQAWLWYD